MATPRIAERRGGCHGAPFCYVADMKKTEKPPPRLEDVELYPDAMERLERAIKSAARHGPVPRAAIKRQAPQANQAAFYSIKPKRNWRGGSAFRGRSFAFSPLERNLFFAGFFGPLAPRVRR